MESVSKRNASRSSSPLIRHMQRQQNQDISWLAELRHHHHEHQTDHNEVQHSCLASCSVEGIFHLLLPLPRNHVLDSLHVIQSVRSYVCYTLCMLHPMYAARFVVSLHARRRNSQRHCTSYAHYQSKLLPHAAAGHVHSNWQSA